MIINICIYSVPGNTLSYVPYLFFGVTLWGFLLLDYRWENWAVERVSSLVSGKSGIWMQTNNFRSLLLITALLPSHSGIQYLHTVSSLVSVSSLAHLLSILCTMSWMSFQNWKRNPATPLLKPFNDSSLFLGWGPNWLIGPTEPV